MLVFNEKKTSFNLFIDNKFITIILRVWFKKLVNGFEEFGVFLAKFGSTFAKKLLNFSATVFISFISFFY